MRSLRRSAVLVIISRLLVTIAGAAEPNPLAVTKEAPSARGRELFLRQWLPDDPRGRGGLGPLYNAASCADCHRQGGTGGSGPIDRNVEIVTRNFRSTAAIAARDREKESSARRAAGDEDGGNTDNFLEAMDREVQELREAHPALLTAGSVILHRYGTEPSYRAWRLRRVDGVEHAEMAEAGGDADRDRVREAMLKGDPAPRSAGRKRLDPPRPQTRNRVTGIMLLGNVASLTQRNTPALFGAGLIDAIPVGILEQVARAVDPKVGGRLSGLSDGRVGRFGWKAQTASLREFVMAACAVEIGLEVPGHHQARPPLDFGSKSRMPAKLDLDGDDCDALTAFVAGLPAPAAARLPEPEGQAARRGRERFVAIGCAACHRPDVGPVTGVYSDLLLHDMGEDLADGGSVYYGVALPGGVPSGRFEGANPQEWRTTPLWGFRDSGPYLHDGRAATLEQAVALHGGQAERASSAYFALGLGERSEVEAFLNSLVAPAVP
jgi:CxxC motif-containing protein (DUF1111 family)